MSSPSQDSWTQDEIDAHEARGGAWGGGGRPIPGIDYSTLPSFMQPLKTSRDGNREATPEDDGDEDRAWRMALEDGMPQLWTAQAIFSFATYEGTETVSLDSGQYRMIDLEIQLNICHPVG